MSNAPKYADIKQTAVFGLGTMGHGIAQAMAAAGCEVKAYDESPPARASLKQRIEANLRQQAAVGIVDEDSIGEILDRITVCEREADAIAGVDFVTEAVVEDLPTKQELFARLETIVDPETILASNTSSYPITEIAARMQHPERAVVTHWFNPPHIVPVVEVVPGQRTSPETAETAYRFLERIGKLPVRLNQEIPGFLVNRVQTAMFREIWDLLDRGVAGPEDIDRAIRGSIGLRLAALGPLTISDFAGWDVTARVYQNLIPHQRSDTELPQCVQSLIAEQRFGAKSGRGVYDYPPETVEQRIAERDRIFLELIKLLDASA